MSEHYQYLIIGGGLAGYFFANQLIKNNKSFLLYDPNCEVTSSKVAAGMFNPVSGKRMTLNWKVNELLFELKNTFAELEAKLNEKFIEFAPIQQVFGNTKESNDFYSRMHDENFKVFINESQNCEPFLLAPDGCFEVQNGGWVDAAKFLEKYRGFLDVEQKLKPEIINYPELIQNEKYWQYQGNTFDYVICCEGYQAINNPYLKWLPFKLCKGQLLLIHCAGLNKNKIVKKGVYLIHQGDDFYKAGATYEWDDIDVNYNDEGKILLITKLEDMLSLPFKVIDQYAGIRPTTRDRRAIAGMHPHVNKLYVFNGLGTKGILQAPYLAKHLYEHIENKSELDKEVDIVRFASFYLSGQR